MTNKEKYDQVFIDSFGVKQEQLNSKLIYQSINEWDSVGHMSMIAGIEEIFDITLDIDDITEFSSYGEGIEILKRYKINF